MLVAEDCTAGGTLPDDVVQLSGAKQSAAGITSVVA